MKNIICCFLCFLTASVFGQDLSLVLPVGHTKKISFAAFSPDDKRILTISEDHTAKIWDANSGSLLTTLKGHGKGITSAQFSPDGKRIVTSSWDYVVPEDLVAKVWDAATGALLMDLTGHTDNIRSVKFSPDGKKLITASQDNTAKIWDAFTGVLLSQVKEDTTNIAFADFSPDGKKIITLSGAVIKIRDAVTGALLLKCTGHTDVVISVEFSPDGNRIVSGSWDHTAIVWDVVTGSKIVVLKGHDRLVSSAHFSLDGNRVLTSSNDETARIWDAGNGRLLVDLRGHSDKINNAAFSPDNTKIVTSSWDNTAKVWNALTGVLEADLTGHHGGVNYAQFSTSGRKIVTVTGEIGGGADFTAKVWDAVKGTLLTSLRSHTANFESAEFMENDKKIFTVMQDRSAGIWDAAKGNPLFSLKEERGIFSFAELSPDGQKILTLSGAYGMQVAKLWQFSTGILLKVFKGHTKNITSTHFSPDGKKVVTSSWDNTAMVWDVHTGLPLHSLKGHTGYVYSVEFSPDGKKIITASGDRTAKTWDASTGKLLKDLKGHYGETRSAQFSPDGQKILTWSEDDIIKLWDPATGILLTEMNPKTGDVNSAEFSPDGTKILVVYGGFAGKTIKIWNSNGTLLFDLKGHTMRVTSAHFSSDNKKVVTSSWDKTARVWDAATGDLLHVLSGHLDFINSAEFSLDGKKIITASLDNTAKIWEAETGKLVFSFLPIDSVDYINLLPTGYYQSTSNAVKLFHYVTRDLKVVSFEQLDIKYNRPDKVLEAIGSTDTALIRSYRKAYEKRIKKLGIDTTAFRDGYSVPEADFANRDVIGFEQRDGKLKLDITAVDSTYKLDRFNIWVNETPVYGQRGLSLRSKNKNSFDSSITIGLSQGENKIETSITNANGTESYRMPLTVNYAPAELQPTRTYFIGIGIDQFKDIKYNLKYSTKDIRDLAIELKEKYKDIIIDTLFNEAVTITKVKALKQKLLQTSVNDKVIISYSGHGMLSKDFDYYLSTYAVNFDKPEESGLPYDELESLLDSIPARKMLMLIDACHSGEVDKDDLAALNATDTKLIKGLKPVAYKKDGQLGLKNSFELMQSLFVNVGKSTGATIISAAAGTQFALEGVNNLPNGVFTYCILEAMNKYPTMKISELKKIVGDRVVEITKGLQKPTSRNETIAVDWEVW